MPGWLRPGRRSHVRGWGALCTGHDTVQCQSAAHPRPLAEGRWQSALIGLRLAHDPRPGLCLKGRGTIGAVPERLQSCHRGCEIGWGGGGFWRLEMRVGLVLEYGNAFGVESVQWGGGRGVTPPPPQGVALIFIPAGGGAPPWTPSLPPLDPLPPSPSPPSALIYLRIRVLGTFFRLGQFFSSHAFGAPIAGFFGHSTLSFLPSVADTMSPRKTQRRCKRDPLFSLPRWMDWEEKARGIQRGTESMFHTVSEHSNGNSV